jgi:hypothetical protein
MGKTTAETLRKIASQMQDWLWLGGGVMLLERIMEKTEERRQLVELPGNPL